MAQGRTGFLKTQSQPSRRMIFITVLIVLLMIFCGSVALKRYLTRESVAQVNHSLSKYCHRDPYMC